MKIQSRFSLILREALHAGWYPLQSEFKNQREVLLFQITNLSL